MKGNLSIWEETAPPSGGNALGYFLSPGLGLGLDFVDHFGATGEAAVSTRHLENMPVRRAGLLPRLLVHLWRFVILRMHIHNEQAKCPGLEEERMTDLTTKSTASCLQSAAWGGKRSR